MDGVIGYSAWTWLVRVLPSNRLYRFVAVSYTTSTVGLRFGVIYSTLLYDVAILYATEPNVNDKYIAQHWRFT